MPFKKIADIPLIQGGLLWSQENCGYEGKCVIGKKSEGPRVMVHNATVTRIRNATMAEMFLCIYLNKQPYINRVLFDGISQELQGKLHFFDGLSVGAIGSWARDHTFSMDVDPLNARAGSLSGFAAICLNRFCEERFGVFSVMNSKVIDCWQLKRISNKREFFAGSEIEHANGSTVSGLSTQLVAKVNEWVPALNAPVIDGGDVKGLVHIGFQGIPTSIEEVNRRLKKYGLQFVFGPKLIPMVVFRKDAKY